MIIFLTWFVLSFVVASIGSKKKIGYLGTLVLSLIFSPIIGLIIALASSDKKMPEPEYKCKFCGFTSNVNSHFCPACDKDDKGLLKVDYVKKSNTNEI